MVRHERAPYGRFKIVREIDLFQLWIQCPKNGAGRLVGRLVLKVDFKRLLLAVPFSPLDNSNTWPQTVFMIQTDDQGAFIRIELDEAPERVDAQGLDGDLHQRLLIPAFRSQARRAAGSHRAAAAADGHVAR
jgi:hypothetical protein